MVRCAAVKGGSTLAFRPILVLKPSSRIASPAGIGAFVANTEYAHGGISLQGCVIGTRSERRETVTAEITDITARDALPNYGRAPLLASTQTCVNSKQAASSIAAALKARKDGEALAVSDDGHEGASASVVIFDASVSVD